MPKKQYWAHILSGGAAGALDLIDGTALNDLDMAYVVTADLFYTYTLDADSGASESSPDVISPDTNAGTKRWILTGIGAGITTFTNTGLHIFDTNATHDFIIKPGSDLTADRTFTLTTGDADRTFTLNENLTIGNGFDVTVTAEDAAGSLTLDNCNLEVEDTVGSGNTIKFVIGTDDASRTVTLSENLTVADGYNFTLQALGQADSLILNESLTVGDGNDGTLTFKQASKALNVEGTNLIPYTGWPVTPGVTLSFGGTRTVTVTDGGSAYYYCQGVKYILGGNKTVQITDTEGVWYIYFSGATLTASQTPWVFEDEDKVLVTIVHWDATNSKQTFLGYELHTYVMDGATHSRLHDAGGAAWQDGLLVSDAGSEVVDVAAGEFHDEDLHLDISDGAGAALFEQVLSPAELPVYYRSGASAWRIYETTDKANATDSGYVDGSNNLHYNKLNGTWASTAATGARHVAYYVIATNDQTEPVALIMGQRQDTTLANAKENNVFSGLSLTGLPFQEMIVLARLILKETGSGVYYTLEEIVDLRNTNITGNVTSPLITDHGGLGGLGDDDHQQYTANADTDVSGNSWVLDENNMASDDDTKLATQQSIKAYADAIGGISFALAVTLGTL